MRLFIFTLITLLYQSFTLACDFQVSNFGDSKNKLKFNGPQPLLMPDRFGGESLVFPLTDICKNAKSLEGTVVSYLYINDKFTRIQLYRANMKDTNLMDFGMKKYGAFSLPEGLPKNKWRGNHIWDFQNEYVEYFFTDIFDGHAEVIEVNSKLYGNLITDYNEEVGKWLDSQKK